MTGLDINIDGTAYTAELLEEEAPASITALRDQLPLDAEVMHVRWSGHAIWISIDDLEMPNLPRENHTVYPSRGDVLLYPGYRNPKEILIACGLTCFKSPAGELAGNHIATISASREELLSLETETLKTGAKPVRISSTYE